MRPHSRMRPTLAHVHTHPSVCEWLLNGFETQVDAYGPVMVASKYESDKGYKSKSSKSSKKW